MLVKQARKTLTFYILTCCLSIREEKAYGCKSTALQKSAVKCLVLSITVLAPMFLLLPTVPTCVMCLQEYPIELTVLPGKNTAEEMEED